MSIQVETTSGLERKMTIAVPSETVEQTIDQRLNQLKKKVRLQGFRPGKVPDKVMRERYGDDVRREVLEDLMQRSYSKGLADNKLQPAAMPTIKTESDQPGQDLVYSATFEIFPVVELPKIEGLAVDRPQVEITDKDVDNVIERLRKQHADWQQAERAIENNDRVTIDYAGFEGTLKKKAVEGASGEDVVVEVGSKRLFESIETGLLGMSVNESKRVKVKIPKDYPNDNMAGKTLAYELTIKKIEQPLLPEVDESFCEKLSIEGGVEQLRKEVRENMERELKATIENNVHDQLIEQLIANNPIEVPKGLVEQEARHRQRTVAAQMGIPEPHQHGPDCDHDHDHDHEHDELQSKLPPLDGFKPAAQQAVAFSLLVQALIERESIKPGQEQIQQQLWNAASRYQDPQEAIKQMSQNPQVMHQFEQSAAQQQAIDWLLERAQVGDASKTFDEVMGTPAAAN